MNISISLEYMKKKESSYVKISNLTSIYIVYGYVIYIKTMKIMGFAKEKGKYKEGFTSV